MASLIITTLVLLGLGLLTRGFVLRWYGIGCMLVGICFALVLMVTGSHDVGGYLVHAGITAFGLACWMGGHIIYATRMNVWRSATARSMFVGFSDFRAGMRSTRARA